MVLGEKREGGGREKGKRRRRGREGEGGSMEMVGMSNQH